MVSEQEAEPESWCLHFSDAASEQSGALLCAAEIAVLNRKKALLLQPAASLG